MAVVHSAENIPALAEENSCQQCSICLQEMVEQKDCSMTPCHHKYHTICIIKWITEHKECPVCRRLCHTKDLQSVQDLNQNNTFNTRITPTLNKPTSRGRGKVTRQVQTRFSNRRRENPGSQSLREENVERIPSNTANGANDQIPFIAFNLPSRNSNANSSDDGINIDYSRISTMIEDTVQRMFANIHLNNVPNASNMASVPLDTSDVAPSTYQNRLNPSKISTIIQNWKVQFDGSSEGLNVEEFIYRIRALTRESFNNDFSHICKNLHILLSGKARDWFWRYHKQVPRIEWPDFCSALRYQYKDYRSNIDFSEQIRNRKQKPNENF